MVPFISPTPPIILVPPSTTTVITFICIFVPASYLRLVNLPIQVIAAKLAITPSITYANKITLSVLIPEYLVAPSFNPIAKIFLPYVDFCKIITKIMATTI